jgi:hypothetical protein
MVFSVALERVVQSILERVERGCLSRSTFNNPQTRGIRMLLWQSGLLRVGHPRSVPFGNTPFGKGGLSRQQFRVTDGGPAIPE